jgi:hypothetical protein
VGWRIDSVISDALRPQIRPGSGRYREENTYKFPFEAFEADNPRGNSAPELTLVDPWTLNIESGALSGITLIPTAAFTAGTINTYLQYVLPPLCPIGIHKSLVAAMGSALSSGTCTTDTADTVIDSGATFSTDGVAVGDIIHNEDDDYWGTVVSVDSETQLTADWDVCPDGNEAYSIYNEPTWPSNVWECDGSQVSDGESPINGMYLPDCNGTLGSWTTGRVVRGQQTAGRELEDAFQGHEHKYYRAYKGIDVKEQNSAVFDNKTNDYSTAAVRDKSGYGTARFDEETRGKSVSLVYVMRIK